MQPTHVLGLAGSLRSGSYNRALLRAARELAPAGLYIEGFDLGDLPLYNADLDTEALRPEPVRRFKAAVEAADALLIATPEYNHSTSGVLQNAIDWASRPARRSPLKDKPVGIMSAAPGALGGARAQEHLKLVLLAVLAHVMPHAGVVVGHAGQKFDENGRLTDETTRRFLRQFLEDLQAWTQRVRQAVPLGEVA